MCSRDSLKSPYKNGEGNDEISDYRSEKMFHILNIWQIIKWGWFWLKMT
jgi:hypothetical protein